MVRVFVKCKECGKEFEMGAKEREFYLSRNLSLPKRCKDCRKKRKKEKKSEVK